DVYELVLDQLQSNEICTSSGICTVGLSKMRQEILVPQKNNFQIFCTDCEKITRHAQQSLLKNMSVSVFKQKLQEKCKLSLSFETDCLSFADQYYYEIYTLVNRKVNSSQICQFIGVCHNAQNQHESLLDFSPNLKDSISILSHNHYDSIEDVKTNFSPNCNFCMNIIQTLQKFVNQHYDMKTALDSVCSVQPNEDLKYKCWEMLETHKLQIIELLSKNVAYHEICRTINMCSLLEDGYEQHNWQNRAECYVCKKVIKEFKKFAEHHNDKGSIERAVHQICHKLGKLSHKCEKLAEKHLNKIVDLILKRVDNKKICKTIGMCKSSIRKEDVELFQKDTETSKALQGLQLENPKQGPFRLICELVLEKIEMLLDTKEKRNHILHRMLFTCDKLPRFMREPCQDGIHSYGYALLDLLSKVTPHEFCHTL
ncbi:hypothetical protein KR215_007782, partial [Drosophila sulfurigaster]